jgi:hypothetical protein
LRLKIDNEIAKCLIIYPNKDKTSNDLFNLWNDGEEIQGFVDFKKNRRQTTSLPHLKIKITAQSREGFVTLPNSKFKDGLQTHPYLLTPKWLTCCSFTFILTPWE